MENITREIIADAIDRDELYAAIQAVVADRIDYIEIAERIADSIDSDEIAKIALDMLGETC